MAPLTQNEPVGHVAQSSMDVELAVPFHVPAGHSTADVAPALQKLPAGHGLHDVCPSWSWKVPCEHTSPLLYLPATVGVHFALESKPVEVPTLPAGQSLQSLSDEMPFALLYLPNKQSSQLFASEVYSALLAFLLPYFPAGQGSQDVCPT